MKGNVQRSAAQNYVRFWFLVGILEVVGFALGTGTAEAGSGIIAGVIWTVATFIGLMAGLLAFLVVADLFLSEGPDDDVIARLAGGTLMISFMVLGAIGMWTYLFSSS